MKETTAKKEAPKKVLTIDERIGALKADIDAKELVALRAEKKLDADKAKVEQELKQMIAQLQNTYSEVDRLKHTLATLEEIKKG